MFRFLGIMCTVSIISHSSSEPSLAKAQDTKYSQKPVRAVNGLCREAQKEATHSFRYPTPKTSTACGLDQMRHVLARRTWA